MENIFWGINIATIIIISLSIVYTAGVVWRVEMELDISYKFFLAAIVLLLLAELSDFYYSLDNGFFWIIIVKSLRMLFAVNFLIGILLMRKIVRRLDGEKSEKNMNQKP
jgi:hypothetical protein